jgi:peptidoglycan/xylan/chitin deacetylase (PgdA/CDA1 family)
MKFRPDRFLSVHVVSFLRFLYGNQPAIPVLMYHSIAPEQQSAVHPYYRTTTPPALFDQHLRFLQQQGYMSCSLTDAITQLREPVSTTGKPVVITFDDGFGDFYHNAFPILQRHGFTATVFLPTAYIGENPIPFNGKDCMTWQQVRELHRKGVKFGSHTVHHPQLRSLSLQAIDTELLESKSTIEDKLGCPVTSFAYPYAFPQTDSNFKEQLRDSLRRAGYDNGVCTVLGRANRKSDPLFLERLPVNCGDDNRLFAAKLSGAYDFMAKLQYVSKMTRIPAFRPVQATKPIVSKHFPEVPRPS